MSIVLVTFSSLGQLPDAHRVKERLNLAHGLGAESQLPGSKAEVAWWRVRERGAARLTAARKQRRKGTGAGEQTPLKARAQ